MANDLLDRAWAVPASEVDGTEKLVLANLCDRANKAGDNLFMSVTAVAKETALHRLTAQRALTKLESKGFIKRIGVRSRGVIHYAINIAALRWERRRPDGPVAQSNTCSAALQAPVAQSNSDLLRSATQTPSKPLVEPFSPGDAGASEREPLVDDVLANLAIAYSKCHNGATLAINRKRHGSNVRHLLKSFDGDRIVLLFRELQKLPSGIDSWIDGSDRGIEVLTRKASFIDARVRQRDALRHASALDNVARCGCGSLLEALHDGTHRCVRGCPQPIEPRRKAS